MERLSCTSCGSRVGAKDVVCRTCGAPLLEDGAVFAEVLPDRPAGELEQAPAPDQTRTPGRTPDLSCPHCSEPVPDPQNLVCLNCLNELPGARPSEWASVVPRATTGELGPPALTLRFGFGSVELRAGEELALGRETPGGRAPALAGLDNVSRRHATVGIDSDGVAWVRDEGSTNGTYVDGRPTPSGVVTRLTDGSELRLASNVRAVVALRGPADG